MKKEMNSYERGIPVEVWDELLASEERSRATLLICIFNAPAVYAQKAWTILRESEDCSVWSLAQVVCYGDKDCRAEAWALLVERMNVTVGVLRFMYHNAYPEHSSAARFLLNEQFGLSA